MARPYINRATAVLVEGIRKAVLQENQEKTVWKAYDAFDETCKTPPKIVEYIKAKCLRRKNRTEISKLQLEILMFAMMARSSSTYGTIPGVVAHLALVGAHKNAAILNENAMNETGDRSRRPHPILLYDSIKVLSDALDLHPLTPASYHIARNIFLGRKRGDKELSEPTTPHVRDHLEENKIFIPSGNEKDIEDGIYYSRIVDSDMIDLHSIILQAESRLSDGFAVDDERNLYCRDWIALRLLELAMREASSVDEHETGRLSYIGTWGLLLEALDEYIPSDQLERALAWVKAHNDEQMGQSVGWQGAAEEGHAEDARLEAVELLKSLDADSLATVLAEVTRLNRLRLNFWHHVVEKMEQAQSADLITLRNLTRYRHDF